MSSDIDRSTSKQSADPTRRSRTAALLAGVPVAVLSFGAFTPPLAMATSAASHTSVQASSHDQCNDAGIAAELATDISSASAQVLKWPNCAGD